MTNNSTNELELDEKNARQHAAEMGRRLRAAQDNLIAGRAAQSDQDSCSFTKSEGDWKQAVAEYLDALTKLSQVLDRQAPLTLTAAIRSAN